MADYIRMTALSPTMEEGTILKWKIKTGDRINTGTVICEIETDKASMEYEATDEGYLLDIIVQEGGKAKVGEPIAIIGEKGEDISGLKNKIKEEPQTQKTGIKEKKETESASSRPEIQSKLPEDRRIKISPLAKNLALKYNLDINTVTGSGPGGRIIKDDIEKYLKSGEKKIEKTGFSYTPVILEDKIINLTQKRRVIAKKLSQSKFSAPHFYLTVKIFCDELLFTREKLNLELKDERLSLNAFLIKLSAEAIKRHPAINSTWAEDKIIQHGSIDMGLAVALEDGLITPIVKDCGNKGIRQIDYEIKELIRKAGENKLTLDQITGATFTVSNLGSYDIDEFTAIINPPGSAILAVGKANKEPIVNERDEIEIKKTIKFTLSCDHRVIDGANGAEFLKTLKNLIEYPINILL